jgi:high-affinity iron transporter
LVAYAQILELRLNLILKEDGITPMLQAFVITLREGLEAFLIIAISLAYLRKSGRRELIPAVHWGIGLSVLLSIGAAYLFQQASNQAFWEGALALAAAVSVATLTVHMWRTARKIKSEIEGQLRASTEKTGTAAWLGVFFFTLLMISREGMETALLMGTLLTQVKTMTIIAGAIGGTLASAAIAMMWSKYGHRVNLALFFQVTAIFLLVFVAQLLVYGLHEMTEANIFPNSEALHWATEPYGPDGIYGQYLTYLLVAGPLSWLLFAMLTGNGRRPQAPAAPGRAA